MTRLRVLLAVLVALLLAFPVGAQGYRNGHLPASALAPISEPQPCAQLREDAAAAWNTMALYTRHTLTVNGCDSSYRPYSRQVYWRKVWCSRGLCANAAVPGFSNHGLGIAVDIPVSTRAVLYRSGRKFGWCKCWSDAPWEPWHFRYTPGKWERRPNPGRDRDFPVLRRGSGGWSQARAVHALRRHLRAHHYRVSLKGNFGPDLERVVRKFQKRHHLPVSGVVRSGAWRVLRRH